MAASEPPMAAASSAPLIDEVPERVSFPGEEERVLRLWEKLDAFHESLRRTENCPEFSFYDGPPFATGLPHYGHILTGTIKDIVTRYATQTGHHVVRRFGWDCHGLPVEYEIDQQEKIKVREDVLRMGIDVYNEKCRAIVMRYSKQWESIVTRLGRWIDFDNGYRTMDCKFMESVWWVFKQLFQKGLVYRGFKVMPFSTGCATALSNFEAKQNYKEVKDPQAYVAFSVSGEPNTFFVAWTTTPWTLPSNLALCVHPEFVYARVKDTASGRTYIVLESLAKSLMKQFGVKAFTVTGKVIGQDLANTKYEPLFPYFRDEATAFRVLVDRYVTSDTGTGVVHCAPGFGEDDHRVCLAAGVIQKGEQVPCPIDDNGLFTAAVSDFAGRYVKDCDKDVLQMLKDQGRLLWRGEYLHKYPFCWRSETPLLYRAVPCWFVNVVSIKDKLVANNKKSYWVPEHVQEKRFNNWLQDANDWAVSRNRFWGTPLPIWVSDDGEEVVCVGSADELAALSGRPVPTDLHRHFIDDFVIPSRQGKGVLRRVSYVFDCWFESGSMPYAQLHYPFENVEYFEKAFPANFIAEGIDQTRGWFYTLLVLSTALFDNTPFKNLVVNGLVLASDGKKMSKRLRNYPDPMDVVSANGADALRLYLINSPVVRGENLKFQLGELQDIVKTIFLPWYHAFRFFVENYRAAQHQGMGFVANFDQTPTNLMDRWILSACQSLIEYVRVEMSKYRLYTVVPRLLQFREFLTNWYVRLNRPRMKGKFGRDDAVASLNTLLEVLVTLARAMSPFTPFLTEYMYQTLRPVLPAALQDDSIHFLSFPEARESVFDRDAERQVSVMQAVVEATRAIRDKECLSLRIPLRELVVVHADPALLDCVRAMESYVKAEMNVRSVKITDAEQDYATLSVAPDHTALGRRLGKRFTKELKDAIANMSQADVLALKSTGRVTLCNEPITLDEVKVVRVVQAGVNFKANSDGQYDFLCLLDTQRYPDLMLEATARDLLSKVQLMRKRCGLVRTNEIECFFDCTSESVEQATTACRALIVDTLRVPLLPVSRKPAYAVVLREETFDVGGVATRLVLTRGCLHLSADAVRRFAKTPEALVRSYVASLSYDSARSAAASGSGELQVAVEGELQTLKLGTDVLFATPEQ